MTPLLGFSWSPSEASLNEDWAALCATGANLVIIPRHALTTRLLDRLRAQGVAVAVDLALFAGAALRDAFPDSAPIDAHGVAMAPDDWYVPVCPNHPRVRAHHMADLTDLLEQHGDTLAGVWLDFIRYPMRWEVPQPRLVQSCFCDRCLGGFLDAAGRAFSPEERRATTRAILAEPADAWADWKCRQIAGCVQEIAHRIRDRRPALPLGLFALPWRLADHGGAIRSIVSQDLARLGPLVDVISPMTYHRLCGQDIPWIADVVREARERSGAAVLPVIQSLDLPDPLADEAFHQALVTGLSVSDHGLLIFDLRAVARRPQRVTLVRAAFASARRGA